MTYLIDYISMARQLGLGPQVGDSGLTQDDCKRVLEAHLNTIEELRREQEGSRYTSKSFEEFYSSKLIYLR